MKSDLPFMMPSEKAFGDRMRVLGVKMTDHVVCYDAGAMQFFGHRAAWMFSAMGHPNVQVLDGGFPKWTKEGLAVHTCHGDLKEADFAYKLQDDKVWNLEKVKAFEQAQGSAQVLDVRAPDQFGAGSIKGASNVPVGKIINMDTKTLKTADERKAVFAEAGIDLSKDITLSCGGGIAATVVYNSLSDIATGKIAVYDGSWAEYSKNM